MVTRSCSSRRGIGTTTTPRSRCSRCTPRGGCAFPQRAMYLGARHARRGIFIDEAWVLSTFSTGRRFIEHAGRDSRNLNPGADGQPEPLRSPAIGPGEHRIGSVHRSAHGRGRRRRTRCGSSLASSRCARTDLRVALASERDLSPRSSRVRVQRRGCVYRRCTLGVARVLATGERGRAAHGAAAPPQSFRAPSASGSTAGSGSSVRSR
jgi:hypothetical protein